MSETGCEGNCRYASFRRQASRMPISAHNSGIRFPPSTIGNPWAKNLTISHERQVRKIGSRPYPTWEQPVCKPQQRRIATGTCGTAQVGRGRSCFHQAKEPWSGRYRPGKGAPWRKDSYGDTRFCRHWPSGNRISCQGHPEELWDRWYGQRWTNRNSGRPTGRGGADFDGGWISTGFCWWLGIETGLMKWPG